MRADPHVVTRVGVTRVEVDDDGNGRTTTIRVDEGTSRHLGAAPAPDTVPAVVRTAIMGWLTPKDTP